MVEEAAAWLTPHARFAVACRTAGWLTGAQYVLQDRFGDLAIFDLMPLSIAAYARPADIDDAFFLRTLEDANVLALASNPQELSLFSRSSLRSAAHPIVYTTFYGIARMRLRRRLWPRRMFA